MRQKIFALLAGMALGMALLSGGYAAAGTALTATPSTQTFYVNGRKVVFEAYAIHGNNFVKLRDIGRAVDFGVAYDGAANSVHISPDAPYAEEVSIPPAPSALTEENVRAAIVALKELYPDGALYGAPYVPNNPLSRPYSNCDACAGWAMKCSDAAFGDLPWRRVENPEWGDIRAGDLVQYDNQYGGHVVVVLERTDDYIKVTESGSNNKALWGGQYFKWWLEEQPGYALRTRYPE